MRKGRRRDEQAGLQRRIIEVKKDKIYFFILLFVF